jgi:hypothetical protein
MIAGLVAALVPAGGCSKSSSSGVVTVDVTKPAPVVLAEPKTEPVSINAPAAFAEDFGSKVVARTLAPPEAPKVPVGQRTKPLPWHGLDSLEKPGLELAPPLSVLISLAPAKSRTPRPRMLADLTPLADYTAEPAPPQRLDLPPPRLVRTPSRDVNLPIDLSLQTSYRPDRASLDDPAAEFALESAQAAPSPLREQPAPFVPVNLPEPFPNRANITSPAAEPPVVAPTPQPPK